MANDTVPSDAARQLAEQGRALMYQARLTEAEAACRQALAIDPSCAEAYANLGAIHCYQWRLDEAYPAFRNALALRPGLMKAHSNLLFSMNYSSRFTQEEIFKESLEWACRHGATGQTDNLAVDRTPDRRLRIGYLSADFRRHSVSYFFESLLSAHDHDAFETVCYADVPVPDEVTARLQSLAYSWRPVADLDDDALFELIRSDRIDILVDLTVHTGQRIRLPVVARRAAPLQVNWLGFPNTSGVSAMDYRFTDAVADPEGEDDAYYTERLVRLPGCFLCYTPPLDAPRVEPLPAARNGFVTFGSFNMLPKITPEAIGVWSRLLGRVADSRLLLKSHYFADAETVARFHAAFEAEGIDPRRVLLHPAVPTTRAHLEKYGEVDIALDTFPYNGTTTTLEALWMGVPVVTLAGSRHASRVGASVLTHGGFEHLVAATPEAYLDIAVRLAADPEALAETRRTLRSLVFVSPLCDTVSFAAKIEDAYREMWRIWCAGKGATRLHVDKN